MRTSARKGGRGLLSPAAGCMSGKVVGGVMLWLKNTKVQSVQSGLLDTKSLVEGRRKYILGF